MSARRNDDDDDGWGQTPDGGPAELHNCGDLRDGGGSGPGPGDAAAAERVCAGVLRPLHVRAVAVDLPRSAAGLLRWLHRRLHEDSGRSPRPWAARRHRGRRSPHAAAARHGRRHHRTGRGRVGGPAKRPGVPLQRPGLRRGLRSGRAPDREMGPAVATEGTLRGAAARPGAARLSLGAGTGRNAVLAQDAEQAPLRERAALDRRPAAWHAQRQPHARRATRAQFRLRHAPAWAGRGAPGRRPGRARTRRAAVPGVHNGQRQHGTLHAPHPGARGRGPLPTYLLPPPVGQDALLPSRPGQRGVHAPRPRRRTARARWRGARGAAARGDRTDHGRRRRAHDIPHVLRPAQRPPRQL